MNRNDYNQVNTDPIKKKNKGCGVLATILFSLAGVTLIILLFVSVGFSVANYNALTVLSASMAESLNTDVKPSPSPPPTTLSPTDAPTPVPWKSFNTEQFAAIESNLSKWLVFGQSECRPNLGVYNKTQFYAALTVELDAVTLFDNLPLTTGGPQNLTDIELKTTIAYIPGITAPTFLPHLNSNVIDSTRFQKFRSVPYSVGYFMNVSMGEILSTDPQLSVFLKNIEDRGTDGSLVRVNLEKRRYMAALTKSKVVNRYTQKIDKFMNTLYDSIVVNGEPVLSIYKDTLIGFFLDIHLGTGNHPEYVKVYFSDFMYFVSIGNPSDADRNRRVMDGHINAPCVREYFRDRVAHIELHKLTDTITWHWIQAGMPYDTVVMECVHNIVAFSQFENTLALLIQQSIAIPTYNPSVGLFVTTSGKSYFQLFREALTEEDKLNVVREMLRVQLPNDAWFSKDLGPSSAPYTSHNQVRHPAKIVAWEGESPASVFPTGAVKWGIYNVARYASYAGKFSDAPATPSPTFDYTDTPAAIRASVEAFTVSPLDNKTVLPNGNENMIPVYNTSLYTPFGLGDRRCPGEIFTQYVLYKQMDKFKCLVFKINNTIPSPMSIPLAPFKLGIDNIYVDLALSNSAACA